MKLITTILGALAEWLGSVVLFPVHLRTTMQLRAVESQAAVRAAHAREKQANAAVMSMLYQMGSDFRPLAKHIALQLHESYGVRPSELTPGTVVPLEKKQ